MASTRKRKRATKTRAPIGATLTGQAALALARMGGAEAVGREFLLDCEVDRVVPLSRTTRWRLRKLNPPQFPEPVKLGPSRVAYRAADIAAVVAGTWQPAAQPAAAA